MSLEEYQYNLSSVLSGELLLFQTLWHNSNDNMFIVSIDDDGDFINEACNEAIEKALKVKKDQLNGIKLKSILDESVYKNISSRYKQCIALNKPINYDESAILDDVGERFFNTTILPVVDKEQNSVKIFGISREFTQLKNIQNELKKLNEILEVKVQERTKELANALDKMKELSITDKLTGLFNRLKLDSVLEENIKISKRYDKTFGVILMDIDFFKNVNDTYGHQLGDTVLMEFAGNLKSAVRESDTVGRWGGEEFLVICPNTDLEGTNTLANNIKQTIKNYEFSAMKHISASFGITTYKAGDNFYDLLKRTDDALYEAKNNGRDSIVTH